MSFKVDYYIEEETLGIYIHGPNSTWETQFLNPNDRFDESNWKETTSQHGYLISYHIKLNKLKTGQTHLLAIKCTPIGTSKEERLYLIIESCHCKINVKQSVMKYRDAVPYVYHDNKWFPAATYIYSNGKYNNPVVKEVDKIPLQFIR